MLAAKPAAARARRPLLALAALVVAFGVVYSLTAPWLAERAWARGTEAGARQAHSYDPLSVDALTLLATYAEQSDLKSALHYYGEAVNLEPQNATTWYAPTTP
jgi:cytochrome c-type biogenesis protein CcmH/NrfG